MRYLLRAILAGGLGFAVSLLIAACGGGTGLLSSDQASTLSNQLTQISSALTAGDCTGAASAANALNEKVNGLPPSVNVTLRNNLIQGASTVSELAQRDCHQTTSTPAVSTTAPPTSTQSTTSTTTSTRSTPSTTGTTPATTPTTSTTPATTPSTSGTTPTGGTGGAGLSGAGSTGGTSNGGPALNTPGATAGTGK